MQYGVWMGVLESYNLVGHDQRNARRGRNMKEIKGKTSLIFDA